MKIKFERFGLTKFIDINEGSYGKVKVNGVLENNIFQVTINERNKHLSPEELALELSDYLFFSKPTEILPEGDAALFIDSGVDVGKVVMKSEATLLKMPLNSENLNLVNFGYLPILNRVIAIDGEDLKQLASFLTNGVDFTNGLIVYESFRASITQDIHRIELYSDKIIMYRNKKMIGYTEKVFAATRFLIQKGYDVFGWIVEGKSFDKQKLQLLNETKIN